MRRVAVFALLLLTACPPPPQVERPYAPPTAADLVAHLRAHAQRITSLRAETKVEHMGNGDRVKIRVSMLLARGGKLRFEAESPLAGAIATLVTDGKDFALLDLRNNKFLTGPANACNVARLIQIEMPPEMIMEALTGSAPIEGEPAGVSWDPQRGGKEVLELKTPDGGKEWIRFDARNRAWDVLSAERKDASGRVLWKIDHESFSDHGGIRLPEVSTLAQPTHKSEARIKFREVEPNVTPKEDVFHLTPPNGVQPELSSCQ
jgi:outer membrane lipoprotein-sorting protein